MKKPGGFTVEKGQQPLTERKLVFTSRLVNYLAIKWAAKNKFLFQDESRDFARIWPEVN